MQSKPTTPLSRRRRDEDDPWANLSGIPRSSSLKLRPPNESTSSTWSTPPPLLLVPAVDPQHGQGSGSVGRANSTANSPMGNNSSKCSNCTPPTRKPRNMTLKLTPARPATPPSTTPRECATSHKNHQHSNHSNNKTAVKSSTNSPSSSNNNHIGNSRANSRTVSPPKTPPVTPDSVLNDGDMDSEFSCSSAASCCWSSSGAVSCEHNGFAPRNGTTFSGRRNKYVMHCSTYAGQVGNEYLTPTQRAQRHIRRLKELLQQARMDVEQRDSEIMKLTREVVELRLFKASLDRGGGGSPTNPPTGEEKSNSSDAVTVRENNDPKTSADVSPIVVDPMEAAATLARHRLSSSHLTERLLLANSSLADSGHFDDMTTTTTTSSSRAGERQKEEEVENESAVDGAAKEEAADESRTQLVAMYERRIAELMHETDERVTNEKRAHNDHVEALLSKLADGQSRYSALMLDHETAKEKIRELERKLDELQARLNDEMDEKNKMYLDKFRREYGEGEEDEPVAGPSHMRDHPQRVAMANGGKSSRVSMADLVQQLQVTQDELENIKEAKAENEGSATGQTLLSAKEAISLWLVGARKTMYEKLVEQNRKAARVNKVDPEVTLQFLKSAIYYFLTDKENSSGHLAAIESILGFTEEEKKKIDKAMNRKSF